MNNITNKIVQGIGISLVALAVIVSTANADTRIIISGNGSDSDNNVRVRSSNSFSISQSNDADIENNVRISSNTGGNRANDNTGGDVDIDTGNIDTSVDIRNRVNANFVSFDGHDDENGDESSSRFGGYFESRHHDESSHDYDHDEDRENHDNDHDEDKDHDYNHDEDKNRGGHDFSYKHRDSQDHDEHKGLDMKFLHTYMSGDQEVPHKGDSDGSGHSMVTVKPHEGLVCVDIKVWGIALPATGSHIHEAPWGAAGPVVVDLPKPDHEGKASGCVTVDKSKAWQIYHNPSNFYVNIHNSEYPDGAVRGQL